MKMLLEKELTVDGLLEYYHEHRKDAFFGPTVDGNMDWVPADKDQEVVMADLTPEGREQEVEDYILGCMAMEVRCSCYTAACSCTRSAHLA